MATTEIEFDDLLFAADERFGDYVINHKDKEGRLRLVLRHLLRMSQEERDELQDILSGADPEADEAEEGSDETPTAGRRDPEEIYRDFIRHVAEDKGIAERFLAVFPKHRLDALKIIQERWFEKTQAGEAKPSSN